MPNRVCRFIFLFGTALCLWLTAAVPSLAGPCTEQSEAPGIFVPDRGCFDLGIGYQFQHFNVPGTTFHNNDYNVNFGMHLFDWVTGAGGRLTAGIEGAVTAGFGGHAGGNPAVPVKSVFLGAGPHIAIESRSRFEPWIHGLAGWERLRLQTATVGASSALGFMVGGGVDIKLAPPISWRFQADYLGTTFQSSLQSNYSFGSGIILHF
jgi:hypothetical protein